MPTTKHTPPTCHTCACSGNNAHSTVPTITTTPPISAVSRNPMRM